MSGTPECTEILTEEQELERDRQELRESHEDLTEILARTRPAAERRRAAMLKMKERWDWDNTQVAAEIGVEKGTVWKAVRPRQSSEESDRALAS